MIHHSRRIIVGAAFALAVLPCFAKAAQTRDEESAKLVAVLRSNAPEFDKAKACQRLAVVGNRDAVPVLAGLLADERLSHYARFGLEPIPDPSVDDALRQALGQLKGKLLVGVIDSIGVRKDAKAVDSLTARLSDADPDVATAAAAAIGRIGTPQTAKILQQTLATASKTIRPAVADAALACAESLAAHGQRTEAIAIYDALRQADLPRHLRIAATHGAIVARQADGLPLLVEQCQSADQAMFNVGLRAARELTCDGVDKLLLAELPKLTAERQAMLIEAIGDRKAPTAVPTLLTAAKSGPAAVRVAAIHALVKLGNPTDVFPVLLTAAVEPEAQVAAAAQAGLAELRESGVDSELVAMLSQGDPKVRRAVIDIVRRRGIASAVPVLEKLLDDPSPEIRDAALNAIGETAGAEEISTLVKRLMAAKSPAERAALQKALQAVCVRVPDREACAETILTAAASASVESRISLLEVLSAVGGSKALKAISAGARDPNSQVQDAACRLLGQWMHADAAPTLLDLAKNSDNGKLKIRALRGYIRVCRQLAVPPEQRLAMCREALALAARDEEKNLALDVLKRVASPESLSLSVEYLNRPNLDDQACAVAMAISERIVLSQPAAVVKAMQQILGKPRNKELDSRAKLLLDRATAMQRAK